MSVFIQGVIYQPNLLQEKQVDFLGNQESLPYFQGFEKTPISDTALFAAIESQICQLLEQLQWDQSELIDIPILLGSTGYIMAAIEYLIEQNLPLPQKPTLNHLADFLHQRFGSKVFSFATSCTSSAQALHFGIKMIEQGQVEKVLILGVEPFNRLTFEHFNAMNLLKSENNPTGMILGEGLACVALSNQPATDFQAEILHSTTLTDNKSLTNSSADALDKLLSSYTENSLQGIKIHGVNGYVDEMEESILEKYFSGIPQLSPKLELGHSLGASGAMETAWLYEKAKKNELKQGNYLQYFLGFGGASVAWILRFTTKSQKCGVNFSSFSPVTHANIVTIYQQWENLAQWDLRSQLKQFGIESRRMSGLTQIALATSLPLLEKITGNTAIFIGSNFSSPAKFSLMCEKLFQHNMPSPLDFMASLNNNVTFQLAQSLKTQGNAVFLAVNQQNFFAPLELALLRLAEIPSQPVLVGWALENDNSQEEQGKSGAVFLLLNQFDSYSEGKVIYQNKTFQLDVAEPLKQQLYNWAEIL